MEEAISSMVRTRTIFMGITLEANTSIFTSCFRISKLGAVLEAITFNCPSHNDSPLRNRFLLPPFQSFSEHLA